MEESGIVSELNLDGATVITSKSSSYQTFLQQLNIDNNSTDLYQQAHCPVIKEGSISSVEVYQKNAPPYGETQFQHEMEGSKRSVIGVMDPKLLAKPQDISTALEKSENSVEFNDKLIWCDECGVSKATDCTEHPPVVISDSRPLSVARQTLPSHFSIITTPDRCYSVVTNKRLKKHTRFGPLGGRVAKADTEQDKHVYKIFTARDSFTYLDTSSEDFSNWMMFIQAAQNASEQNLVAYQHNGHIYFSTKSVIAPGTELKVGFCDSYAALMGVKTLSQAVPPPAPRKVVFKDGFPCDACDHVFVDYESLDAHVCANEVPKQDSTNKGRRTRNKRKGKPQKLGSVPKTKITAGDRQGSKLSSPKVSVVNKYQRAKMETVKCTDCELVFKNRRRLEKHLFVHTGQHPFKCNLENCPKSFNSKFKLERHGLTHGSREFTCAQCGKSFARKDNLKAHLTIHDSSRQLFNCEFKQCSKVYSSKVSFRAHVALHKVEEGSLECYICRKLYDNPLTLSSHIKVHAGSYKTKGIMEKKYKCNTCDKRFFASKDRDRHLLTHTKEKNFECNICFMKFSRSDHLKRHRLKVHPNGQQKPPKSSKMHPKAEKEELAELSANEFTRSIQQILAETNLPMEGPAVSGLNSSADLGVVTNTPGQITPMLNGVIQRSITQSDQRVNTHGFLNILTNSGNQMNKQATSSWQPPADGSTMRYVISGDSVGQSDNSLARYYITSDTVRLPPDGPVTTYLLPSETSQATTVNIDSMPRQSSLMMDSSHALPSDSLSNDFTADGMKVLTGLTPIFLNPDGTTTDTDLIPMVYQTIAQ